MRSSFDGTRLKKKQAKKPQGRGATSQFPLLGASGGQPHTVSRKGLGGPPARCRVEAHRRGDERLGPCRGGAQVARGPDPSLPHVE